jgi:hypothetical protein
VIAATMSWRLDEAAERDIGTNSSCSFTAVPARAVCVVGEHVAVQQRGGELVGLRCDAVGPDDVGHDVGAVRPFVSDRRAVGARHRQQAVVADQHDIVDIRIRARAASIVLPISHDVIGGRDRAAIRVPVR